MGSKRVWAALAVAATISGTPAVQAQMMGPTGNMGFFSNGLARNGATIRGVMDMSAIATVWLTAMHGQLGITMDQEPAWQAFAAAVGAQATAMQAFRTQMMQPTAATAPQRAALAQQFLQQRAQSAGAVTAALDTLYAQLTPQQRSILDLGFSMGFGPGGPFAG